MCPHVCVRLWRRAHRRSGSQRDILGTGYDHAGNGWGLSDVSLACRVIRIRPGGRRTAARHLHGWRSSAPSTATPSSIATATVRRPGRESEHSPIDRGAEDSRCALSRGPRQIHANPQYQEGGRGIADSSSADGAEFGQQGGDTRFAGASGSLGVHATRPDSRARSCQGPKLQRSRGTLRCGLANCVDKAVAAGRAACLCPLLGRLVAVA